MLAQQNSEFCIDSPIHGEIVDSTTAIEYSTEDSVGRTEFCTFVGGRTDVQGPIPHSPEF
jgi:hypothetical protein